MKVFVAVVSLVLGLSSFTTATQQSQATGFVSTDLKSEFLRWKASAAGQQAYAKGFVPPGSKKGKYSTTSADEPTLVELARFQNSLNTIARLQKEQPHATFSTASPFNLMTTEEFEAYVGKGYAHDQMEGLKKTLVPHSVEAGNTSSLMTPPPVNFTTTDHRNLKSETTWSVTVDWQTKGCVTGIKDQGQCGVCWAFAATAALESGYCVNKGSLPVLSEQDIVSCSRPKASCDEWDSPAALDWVTRQNGGSICTAGSYPWVSGSGTAPGCKRTDEPGFTCTNANLGAFFYGGGHFADHTQLEAAVMKQPVAMAVRGAADYFQWYTSGVLMGNEAACPADQTNHAVLIVGFGTRDGIPYWKLKNQWGSEWGENGYIYLERGYQGHKYGACGIELYGVYPIFPASSDPGLNKRTTTPRWGTGIAGTTMKVVGTWAPMECGDLCKQELACKGYNWRDHEYCELKSTNDWLESAAVYSGLVISKADSLKQCGTITDNLDFPGNEEMTSLAATAEDCCDHCTRRVSCNAFAWSKYNRGTCYMKTRAPAKPLMVSPPADGAFIKSAVVYKCQPLQVNTDRTGTDIGSALSSTATNCCGICRSTTNCYAFSWNDYNGGTCWLKGIGSVAFAATGVTSALVY